MASERSANSEAIIPVPKMQSIASGSGNDNYSVQAEYSQQEIRHIQGRIRSATFLEELQKPIYENQQENRHIQGRIMSTTYSGDMHGIENIQTRITTRRSRLNAIEAGENLDRHGIVYIQPTRRSNQPVMQARENEDQQGIEYIQPAMRSNLPIMLARENEDQQAIEYIQTLRRSNRPVMQSPENEDEQGIEYIQPASRSNLPVMLARENEDQHGIEYIQPSMRSNRPVMQSPENEDEQGIEYIQPTSRSNLPVMLARENEDQHGIEYIQNAMKSFAPVLQGSEDEDEDDQGFKYIERPVKSVYVPNFLKDAGFESMEEFGSWLKNRYTSTKPVKSLRVVPHKHEYEDNQRVEFIYEDGVVYLYASTDVYLVEEISSTFLDEREVAESENQKGIDNIQVKEKSTKLPELPNFIKDYGFQSLDELVTWMKIPFSENQKDVIDKILNEPETPDELDDEMDYEIPFRAFIAIRRYKTTFQPEYEDHQGIEYIQNPMKSSGPVLQEHQYEDHQGIEYIQNPIESSGPVLQEREDEDH